MLQATERFYGLDTDHRILILSNYKICDNSHSNRFIWTKVDNRKVNKLKLPITFEKLRNPNTGN